MILHFGCPVLDALSRAGLFGPFAMPKGLHRRYGLRHLHFITCSCYRRLPLFASARAKNLFVAILGEVRDRYGFALAGYVVMPNHIHLLIGEPAKRHPFHRHASLEAARLTSSPPQAAQKTILTSTRASVSSAKRLVAPILAAPLLRFQRLESVQVRRKTSIHAPESRKTKTGHSSRRLAVE